MRINLKFFTEYRFDIANNEAWDRAEFDNFMVRAPVTVPDAVQDLCNSPFKLKDGRLITFCGPHIPDYKAAGRLSGCSSGPRSRHPSLLDLATNEMMGAPASLPS